MWGYIFRLGNSEKIAKYVTGIFLRSIPSNKTLNTCESQDIKLHSLVREKPS